MSISTNVITLYATVNSEFAVTNEEEPSKHIQRRGKGKIVVSLE